MTTLADGDSAARAVFARAELHVAAATHVDLDAGFADLQRRMDAPARSTTSWSSRLASPVAPVRSAQRSGNTRRWALLLACAMAGAVAAVVAFADPLDSTSPPTAAGPTTMQTAPSGPPDPGLGRGAPGGRDPIPLDTTPSTPPTGSTEVSPDRTLTSDGGSVVARCSGTDVYLVSWDPAPGYELTKAEHGPKPQVQVIFKQISADNSKVIMNTQCVDGTPMTVNTSRYEPSTYDPSSDDPLLMLMALDPVGEHSGRRVDTARAGGMTGMARRRRDA